MFSLSDFAQLPQLKPLIGQIVSDGQPGVTIVAGIEAHPQSSPDNDRVFLPSGHNTFFETLYQHIMTVNPSCKATVVLPGKSHPRLPRELRHRIKVFSGDLAGAFPRQLAEAINQKPNLLIVDRLDHESLPYIFRAASQGVRVITLFETALWGYEVVRHLQDLGIEAENLPHLRWILTLRRLPALCRQCLRPALPNPALLARFRMHNPHLYDAINDENMVFYQSIGCAGCRGKGRAGDVLAFDVYSAHPPGKSELEQGSLLPLKFYMLQLAAQGYLSLEDVAFFEADQRKRLYQAYAYSRRTLHEVDSSLKRKLAELEAANQVLLKRTEVLISLQDTVQLLASTASLEELAERVCARARDMCGAERAILYYLHPSDLLDHQARVLAVAGWDKSLVNQRVPASLVTNPALGTQPSACNLMPPGGLPAEYQQEMAHLQSGIQVPLLAQDQRIGLMIIHTTRQRSFTPGDTALLQTFANQAAFAIQRAGLIAELQQKIIQLEAAQKDLVAKESLERELELARQVQQSVLPSVFPSIPGFSFAAKNAPARQVGGDFYDVFLLDDDHFGIVIADVSDKGMPAALYMALTRSLLLAEARRSLSPKEVLTQVNQLLLELGGASQFVSVFFGVIELSSKVLHYTRAGHDRPLLVREKIIYSLKGDGAVLGVLPESDLNLTQEHIPLLPGDRLVLYTDGLIDALSEQGQSFGLGRLHEALQQLSLDSPSEICASLFAQIASHSRDTERYDDTTLLVIGVD